GFAAAGVATSFVSGSVVPVLSFMVLPSWRVRSEPTVSASGAFLPVSVALVTVAALLLGAVALISRMPQDLVPNEDFGVVLVDVKTKDGTSRPQVIETVRNILGRMSAVCDIEKSCTVFGEGIFTPSGENAAKMYLVLKPWSERGAGESTLACIARMREAVADIPEAQVSLMTLTTVPGMGTASYVSPLVLSTADNDPVRLAGEAHRLQAILRRSPLADDVTCGYNTDSPHLRIVVDRAKCELMKVSLSSLFATLQHNLGSIYVNDVNLGTQVNRVTVMSDWKGRSAPEAMAGLYVRSSTGAMVPVSALVEYEEELGPNAVYRYNRYLYCTVDMAQKADVSLQDAMDEISRVFERELPRDYDTGWSGIAYEESSSPGRVGLMVTLSLLAAFLVLMVRFESWRRAALSILPASAAVFGGVLALFATGVPLSLYSRFALLALVVVNVSFTLFTSEGDSWAKRASLPLLAAAMMAPLVFTSGAGAAGSRSFGMTLVGGFLFFALIGLPIANALGRIPLRGKEGRHRDAA
ncbi:MAG: efflux RND transporter permease subunit, partial [bacterium]|nr:efflux RND transporter permease subunit [Candidatus Colisoma equi]